MEVYIRDNCFGPNPFSRLSQGLLDFSKEFDVSLLDKVAMAFYTGRGQEVCISHIFFPQPFP